jgi:hypothetical protein
MRLRPWQKSPAKTPFVGRQQAVADPMRRNYTQA